MECNEIIRVLNEYSDLTEDCNIIKVLKCTDEYGNDYPLRVSFYDAIRFAIDKIQSQEKELEELRYVKKIINVAKENK